MAKYVYKAFTFALVRSLQKQNKMKIVPPNFIASNGPKAFKLDEETIEDSVLNKDNYGAIQVKFQKCSSSRDEEGFCD